MGKPLLNYTTTVDTSKTVAEVMAILIRHGASRITVDYEARRPVAVSFGLDGPAGPDTYRVPARPARALALLKRDKVAPRYATADHAERVAWRIVKDWLEAQLAMIDAGQADLGEILFPFLFDGRRTAFEAFTERRALTGPARE